jgi:hypothetical protein
MLLRKMFILCIALMAARVAADNSDPRMFYPAHIMIQIESYDAKTGYYHIKRPIYPNANSIYATPENLAKAISSLDIKALQQRPQSIVGNEYSTDKDLLIHDTNDPWRNMAGH